MLTYSLTDISAVVCRSMYVIDRALVMERLRVTARLRFVRTTTL